MEKTSAISLDQFLKTNHDKFVRAYGEATAYAQLSWQISEATKDADNLPPLPVVLGWQIHEGRQVIDFARSRYRQISWHYTIMKVCTAAEEYFLAPCIAFEWTRQLKNGRISLSALRDSQEELLASNEHYWRKFKRECGVETEFGQYMDSVLKIRNCIAHRGGVVGPRDIDKKNGSLDVKWLEFYAALEGREITELPFDTGEGGTMTVNWREKVMALTPGQRIEFSLQDVLNIHFTIHSVVAQAHDGSIKRLVKLIGNTSSSDQV